MPTRQRRVGLVAISTLMLVALLGACSSSDDRTSGAATGETTVADLLATDLGGDGSTSLANQNAFSMSARNLAGSERNRFELGDSFFTQNWVTAPATTKVRDGLGPMFNAEACAGCHVLDGRAEPFDPTPTGQAPPTDTTGGTRNPGLLLRLSLPGTGEHGSPKPDPVYGDQLTDRAIVGVPAEGQVQITTTEKKGSFGDGTPYTLQAPTYSIVDPAYGPLPADLQISPRVAPPTIGIGLLEAIPERSVRAAADPDDSNDDGVSGRVNTVWNSVTGRDELGRLGWKANVPTVEQQTANAFLGDIGITSPVHPTTACTPAQTACATAIDGGSPEIDQRTFDNVVFYTRTVAVPKRRPLSRVATEESASSTKQPTSESRAREQEDGATTTTEPRSAKDLAKAERRGAELFLSTGCAACHTPTHTTGDSDIPALAHQTIHPYTDLLVHDMGEGLSDGRPDFAAGPTEWRTAPLWGIGLVDEVNGHTRFLHDGRARNLEEAILWHGGEAAGSQKSYLDMDKSERADLVDFLKTL